MPTEPESVLAFLITATLALAILTFRRKCLYESLNQTSIVHLNSTS